MIMLHIGCHLSSSRGYAHMGKEALSIGADTFQFFTRNPRGGTAKALNTEDLEALRRLLEEHGFTRIMPALRTRGCGSLPAAPWRMT